MPILSPEILIGIVSLLGKIENPQGWTGKYRKEQGAEMKPVASINKVDLSLAAAGVIIKFEFKHDESDPTVTHLSGRGVPHHESITINGDPQTDVDIVISPHSNNGHSLTRMTVEYKIEGDKIHYVFEKTQF